MGISESPILYILCEGLMFKRQLQVKNLILMLICRIDICVNLELGYDGTQKCFGIAILSNLSILLSSQRWDTINLLNGLSAHIYIP